MIVYWMANWINIELHSIQFEQFLSLSLSICVQSFSVLYSLLTGTSSSIVRKRIEFLISISHFSAFFYLLNYDLYLFFFFVNPFSNPLFLHPFQIDFQNVFISDFCIIYLRFSILWQKNRKQNRVQKVK